MKHFTKIFLLTTSYGLLWIIALELKQILKILQG